MEKTSSGGVSDVGAWAMNVISRHYHGKQATHVPNRLCFLLCYNFDWFPLFLDGIGWFGFKCFWLLCVKHVPLWKLLWFSVVANTSISGMNFSLMLNSIGLYQISKLSMIPVVCVMEWILHSKNYTREVKMVVAVVVVGAGVCTVLHFFVIFIS